MTVNEVYIDYVKPGSVIIGGGILTFTLTQATRIANLIGSGHLAIQGYTVISSGAKVNKGFPNIFKLLPD